MQINSFRQKRSNNNSGIKLVNRYIGVTFSLFYADRTSAINGVDSPHTLEETLRGWKTMQSKAFENTFFPLMHKDGDAALTSSVARSIFI